MEKRSKVVNVQGNGTYDSKDGSKTFYKYAIEFENGDAGEYSSVSAEQNKFVKGQEVDYLYDLSRPQYPKIKPVYNYNNSNNTAPKKVNDNVQEYIIKQSTLKCATDYVIANGGSERRVIEIAEIFSQWVLKGEVPQEHPQDMPF